MRPNWLLNIQGGWTVKRSDVAKKIREIRMGNNMTQTELAARCNVTKSLICKIEANKASIHLDLLLDIAKALEVTVSDLLEETPKKLVNIVPESERKKWAANHLSSKVGFEYQRLAGTKESRIETFIMGVGSEAAKTARFVEHDSYEFQFVLSGSLKLEFRDEVYILKTGDAVLFDGSKTHRLTPYHCDFVECLMVLAFTKASG
jgi:transcriptional regulator with XRE-family HTH domain